MTGGVVDAEHYARQPHPTFASLRPPSPQRGGESRAFHLAHLPPDNALY